MVSCIHVYLTDVSMTISLNQYEKSLLSSLLRERISEFSTLLDSKNLDSNNTQHKVVIALSNFELGHCQRLLSKLEA